MKVKIYKDSDHDLPSYQTPGAAGVDLYAKLEAPLELDSLERALVPTGIHLGIPQGYEGQVRARSGLAIKKGLSLANGIGTIDSDYRGEIKVIVVNLSRDKITLQDGDRIAQMVFAKVERAQFEETLSLEELGETKRQEKGFGHTGV
ncbi:MAG: dUTP diphosphatase [Tissierellia bacterium]|nr:dUTP diphosphatase [Tissierellia bacterium]